MMYPVRLEGARQLLLVEGARLRARGVDAERALGLVRLHPRSARRASARLVAAVDQRAHHRVFWIVLRVREARAVRRALCCARWAFVHCSAKLLSLQLL